MGGSQRVERQRDVKYCVVLVRRRYIALSGGSSKYANRERSNFHGIS